jgi:hypothetical protein
VEKQREKEGDSRARVTDRLEMLRYFINIYFDAKDKKQKLYY